MYSLRHKSMNIFEKEPLSFIQKNTILQLSLFKRHGDGFILKIKLILQKKKKNLKQSFSYAPFEIRLDI